MRIDQEIEVLVRKRAELALEIERLTKKQRDDSIVELPQWLNHANEQIETETQIIDIDNEYKLKYGI